MGKVKMLVKSLVGLLLLGTVRATYTNVVRGSALGRTIRLAFPMKNVAPWMTYKDGIVPEANSTSLLEEMSGYIPTLIDDVAKELGARVEVITWAEWPIPSRILDQAFESGTIDMAIHYGITLGTFHPGDGSNKFIHQLGHKYAYTIPLYESYASGLVLRTEQAKNMFNFLKPFTFSLWVATVLYLMLLGAMLVFLQMLAQSKGVMSGDERSAHARLVFKTVPEFISAVCHGIYHSFAAFLGGDDYEYVYPAERVMRLSILFLVLIMVSTYTANLAAFLTQPNFKIHGPKTMADLRTAKACTSNMADMPTDLDMDGLMDDPNQYWGNHPYRQYVGSLTGPSETNCSSWSDCGIEYCETKLINQEVDIWLDDRDGLHSYQVTAPGACNYLSSTSDIGFLHNYHQAWAKLKLSDWGLAANFSESILFFDLTGKKNSMKDKFFKTDSNCGTKLLSTNNGTPSVSFADMEGLFFLCGLIAALAVGMALLRYGRDTLNEAKAKIADLDAKDLDANSRDYQAQEGGWTSAS